jgi:hypothetical protein
MSTKIIIPHTIALPTLAQVAGRDVKDKVAELKVDRGVEAELSAVNKMVHVAGHTMKSSEVLSSAPSSAEVHTERQSLRSSSWMVAGCTNRCCSYQNGCAQYNEDER